jgi:hypothetical protein
VALPFLRAVSHLIRAPDGHDGGEGPSRRKGSAGSDVSRSTGTDLGPRVGPGFVGKIRFRHAEGPRRISSAFVPDAGPAASSPSTVRAGFPGAAVISRTRTGRASTLPEGC